MIFTWQEYMKPYKFEQVVRIKNSHLDLQLFTKDFYHSLFETI